MISNMQSVTDGHCLGLPFAFESAFGARPSPLGMSAGCPILVKPQAAAHFQVVD